MNPEANYTPKKLQSGSEDSEQVPGVEMTIVSTAPEATTNPIDGVASGSLTEPTAGPGNDTGADIADPPTRDVVDGPAAVLYRVPPKAPSSAPPTVFSHAPGPRPANYATGHHPDPGPNSGHPPPRYPTGADVVPGHVYESATNYNASQWYYPQPDPGFDSRCSPPAFFIMAPPPPPQPVYCQPYSHPYNYATCTTYPVNYQTSQMSQYRYVNQGHTAPPPIYGPPAPPPPTPAQQFGARVQVPYLYGGHQSSPDLSSTENNNYNNFTTRRFMGDPEAKIFVGDLPIRRPYQQSQKLEEPLLKLFSYFGFCHVNVSWGEAPSKETVNDRADYANIEYVETKKRTRRLPTAWVQYRNLADVEKVLGEARGSGLYFKGRRLRVERADGKRVIRIWPKEGYPEMSATDLRDEFQRLIQCLVSCYKRDFTHHISETPERVQKRGENVVSLGVMLRWCEDAKHVAEQCKHFPSKLDMNIEPVRSMAGTPPWRTTGSNHAARRDRDFCQNKPWRNTSGGQDDHRNAVDNAVKESETTGERNAQPGPSEDQPEMGNEISSPPGSSAMAVEDIECERGSNVSETELSNHHEDEPEHETSQVVSNELSNDMRDAEASSSIQHEEKPQEFHLVHATAGENEEANDERVNDSTEVDNRNSYPPSQAGDEDAVWDNDSGTLVDVSDSDGTSLSGPIGSTVSI